MNSPRQYISTNALMCILTVTVLQGDVSDLDLTFSLCDATLGTQTEIPLIPQGTQIAVTSSNRHRYIALVAKYYLHDRCLRQTRAFCQGFCEMVVVTPPSSSSSTSSSSSSSSSLPRSKHNLLRLFCAPELQCVLSGLQQEIDCADWQKYTQYAGKRTLRTVLVTRQTTARVGSDGH